ncbi:alpha/beta hydrolase [Amycolatopsis sp. OK19-0408]|uniref:Alpha/beta hydrolase n=1 Tax=Amycolatopsis iheyensis TaxID=2945988 RepID=A0A9X2SJ99_9PSEU|nr:alpha/beta hydrolase [Amycolatopsis iheyensis]MCR6483803.1 alpha/beta hydrolase [Amycolatopsis iheyensis]
MRGFPCYTFRPRGDARSSLHVLHLHGGGYVEQVEKHHWRYAADLVARLGCAVTLPVYPRRSPWSRRPTTRPTRCSASPACAKRAGDAQRTDPHDRLVSPIHADLSGPAPITLFIGTRDVLLPDCRRFRDHASAAGIEVDYREYPGMFHDWLMQAIPEGREAMNHLERLLRRPPVSARSAPARGSGPRPG